MLFPSVRNNPASHEGREESLLTFKFKLQVKVNVPEHPVVLSHCTLRRFFRALIMA